MVFDPDACLAEALSLGPDDAVRAEAMLRQIAEVAPCSAWARAMIELARRESGTANYNEAIVLTRSVLDAPAQAIPEVSRAIAAITMSSAQDMVEEVIDDQLLRRSIETCATSDEPYYAAVGLRILALQQLVKGQRQAARTTLLSAAELFDRAGSMLGGPTALERVARLAIDEGHFAEARQHIDRGILHLQQFPYGGFQVRGLEKKLFELRAQIDNAES